ncbi:MAG: lipopolysaccharide kinase InaA family protein [Paracoccaceae bacterium]
MSGDAFFTNFLPAPARLFKEEQSTVVWVSPAATGERIVLKLYRHRGLWHALRCRVTRYRVQREHERLSHLVQWDVPCTPPRGWSHGYSRENGFYELLATVMVPGARDLESHLKNGRECDFRPILAAIRRMHESGLCHHALYARNILISTVHAFTDISVERGRHTNGAV